MNNPDKQAHENKETNEEKVTFKCHLCDKEYTSVMSLNFHIREAHRDK